MSWFIMYAFENYKPNHEILKNSPQIEFYRGSDLMNSIKEGAKEFKISRSTADSITVDICNTLEFSFRAETQVSEFLCNNRKSCQNVSLQPSISQNFMGNWSEMKLLLRRKLHDSLAGVCQTTLKGLGKHEGKDSLL